MCALLVWCLMGLLALVALVVLVVLVVVVVVLVWWCLGEEAVCASLSHTAHRGPYGAQRRMVVRKDERASDQDQAKQCHEIGAWEPCGGYRESCGLWRVACVECVTHRSIMFLK